jgi:ribosomal protein S18 acetylase RimI-like enzyme
MDCICTTTARADPLREGALLAEDTPAAWRDLARRADEAVVERDADFEPDGWTLLRRTAVLSMISTRRARPSAPPAPVVDLGADDLPGIRRLLDLRGPDAVIPEPVAPELAAASDVPAGSACEHVGIRVGGVLVAAAGLRLPEPRHAEIAFVATHPDHARRGYAGALVDVLVERARRSGRASWLRVRPDDAAVADWGRRGFVPVRVAAVEHRIRAA